MNDTYGADNVVVDDAYRIEHRPEVDRETLDVLAALGLEPRMIDRVRAFLIPKEGQHFHDMGTYPWLPGYRLASELRARMAAANRRPAMYFGMTTQSKLGAVAEWQAELVPIVQAISRRLDAGDRHVMDAVPVVREYQEWLERLERVHSSIDTDAGKDDAAGRIEVLRGLERFRKRPGRFVMVDSTDEDIA